MATTVTDLREATYSVDDGIAVIRLNRPERNNAWTPKMKTDYFDALERADDDPQVRAIVVTGAGKRFCVGADMDVLQSIQSGTAAPDDPRPHTHPLTIRKPIIGAINGAAAGLGFVHTLMCDIRFAGAGTKFTSSFAQRGLVAEHGSSWLLPRLIGPARALDVLLSGRVVLAEEAAELGIVNRVVDPDHLVDEAIAYARTLARSCSPSAMAAMKAQVYGHLTANLPEAVDESNALMAESFRHPDFKEGVQSFVERRDPAFEPLGPRS